MQRKGSPRCNEYVDAEACHVTTASTPSSTPRSPPPPSPPLSSPHRPSKNKRKTFIHPFSIFLDQSFLVLYLYTIEALPENHCFCAVKVSLFLVRRFSTVAEDVLFPKGNVPSPEEWRNAWSYLKQCLYGKLLAFSESRTAR